MQVNILQIQQQGWRYLPLCQDIFCYAQLCFSQIHALFNSQTVLYSPSIAASKSPPILLTTTICLLLFRRGRAHLGQDQKASALPRGPDSSAAKVLTRGPAPIWTIPSNHMIVWVWIPYCIGWGSAPPLIVLSVHSPMGFCTKDVDGLQFQEHATWCFCSKFESIEKYVLLAFHSPDLSLCSSSKSCAVGDGYSTYFVNKIVSLVRILRKYTASTAKILKIM